MKHILQLIKAFLDGFFPIFGLFLIAAAGWYIYIKKGDELAQLPLIREITDTYKTGWEQTLLLGSKVASHIVTIHEKDRIISRKMTQNDAQLKEDDYLSVEIDWSREYIEKKLQKQRWSAKKIKAADAYLSYIDFYLDAAILDMYSTGVTASITIAQGILESNAGRSNLATKTNNHFGIKARANKAGRKKIKAKKYQELRDDDFNYSAPAVGVSQHHDDNKYDRFEVYSSVLDSYKRHSKLLLNSCTKARKGCYAWIWTAFPVQKERVDLTEMAEIFENVSGYAPNDFFGETVVPYYAAQAAGLKMAGYATSKTYHEKIVYIIETYELWRIDIALIRAMRNN